MDSVRVGIVGVGILGERHTRVFSELADAEVVAICDRDKSRVQRMAKHFGVAAFTDVGSMLDESTVDALVVATPDHLHFEPVMVALCAGKHVLVEKPLATTLNEARQMITAAREAETILQVNYSQRFVPEHAWAKREIERGALGDLLVARSITNDTISVPTEMISWASETSPIFFMTSHHIDLVCWYFDVEVEEAYAHSVSGVLHNRGIQADDSVEALVKFSNGATASFHSSWILPNGYPTVADSSLELIGSDGMLLLGRGDSTLAYSSDGVRKINLATAYEFSGELHGAFRNSLATFLQSIKSDTEPSTSGANTLNVTLIQHAIMESLTKRAPIRISEL